MYVSGIQYESVVDGIGIRNTLFISGCRHNCKGCHNPETHNFKYGYEFTIDKQEEFIKKCKENPLLDGITLSGGDPLFSANELIPFIDRYKKANPTHTIWIYSGFTFEQIKNNDEMFSLIKKCDILVDGKFILALKDLALKFRGSSNQRIIDIQKSLENKNVILYEEMIE